ncbi:MAG TPA: hypothetical protein VGQ59_21255, partial [Cyclobacteriaceae bacterium]|nr:hypothetical protein [Cyclobacteriaceae bacterium]
IAHELCHIIEERKLGTRRSLADKLAYKISTRYKTLDERNTDIQVVLRGYGAELLEFMTFAEQKGFDFYEEDGLAVRELKVLLKEVSQND